MIEKVVSISIIAIKSLLVGDEKMHKNLISGILDMVGDVGEDKLGDYIKRCQNEMENLLKDSYLEKMHIKHKEYVREEIKEIIRNLKISNNLIKENNYDVGILEKYLYEQYIKNGSRECEEDIKKMLREISKKAISLSLEQKDFIPNMLIENNKDNIIIKEEINTLNATVRETYNLIKNKDAFDIKNRYEEYQKKWMENLFIHDFDEDDGFEKVKIVLNDLYIVPEYKLPNQETRFNNLEERLSQYICRKNEVKKTNRMLLILGQPGIGKSSLITWICNYYKNHQTEQDLFVYRFIDFNWDIKNIEDNILRFLESININNLVGKTIILDGLDEINLGDKRRFFLETIYDILFNRNDIKQFYLILTCREYYIEKLEKLFHLYITLQPFSEEQISQFIQKYQEKYPLIINDKELDSIYKKKDILGIPFILYITLSLNIKISDDDTTMLDIYEHIFDLENGGIYKRCIYNKKQLVSFDTNHRISKKSIYKTIHQIVQDMAIWMFANEPNKIFIPKSKYISIIKECNLRKRNDIDLKKDVLISNFFKFMRQSEATNCNNIYFVHRSIYEYFVADKFFDAIKYTLMEETDSNQIEFAIKISPLLYLGSLSKEMLTYFSEKVKRYVNIENKYDWIENTIWKMIQNGILYYIKKKPNKWKQFTLLDEAIGFLNMIEFLHYILPSNKNIIFAKYETTYEYTMELINAVYTVKYYNLCNYWILNDPIMDVRINYSKLNLSNIYFKNVDFFELNLTRANLRKAFLIQSNLCKSNLYKADLRKADLRKADLRKANLKEANLNQVNLIKAHLSGANLSGANLSDADLSGADLSDADLSGADLSGVNLSGADLSGANLSDADLSGADLSGADLSDADLSGVNLSDADLSLHRLNDINLEYKIY